MANQFKSLLVVVALIICVPAAEVSRVRNQEIEETRNRFCGLTYEQKSTAVHCILDGVPSGYRKLMLECSKGETRIMVEEFSGGCPNAPQELDLIARIQFLQCLRRKAKENPEIDEELRAFGYESMLILILKCVNQVASEINEAEN